MADENERIFQLLSNAIPPAEPYVPTEFTVESLYAAMEKVRDHVTYTVCIGGDRHVVHPAEWDKGGYAHCGNCAALVYLGER